MTNAIIAWIEKEAGIIKTDAIAIEPAVIAWAKNFLTDIKPVVVKAANDAVLAAVTIPGDGSVKFAGAVAVALADLATQGIPIAENDLKAAVQIAYNALPDDVKATSAATTVQGAIDTAIDTGGAHLAAQAS